MTSTCWILILESTPKSKVGFVYYICRCACKVMWKYELLWLMGVVMINVNVHAKRYSWVQSKSKPQNLLEKKIHLKKKRIFRKYAKIIFKISLPFPREDKFWASKITAKIRPCDPLLSCWFANIILKIVIYAWNKG